MQNLGEGMTKIKLCGLSRPCDIEWANRLRPEYVGFVFAAKSKRYVSPEKAADLRSLLAPGICAVGVFVDEEPEKVACLLETGVIDMAQLHGREGEAYIKRLRRYTDKKIIQAFRIETTEDMKKAEKSRADYVLLDSGAGTGTLFDWELIRGLTRPYFLAGGLTPENVEEAVKKQTPYAVDISSGIETEGYKDRQKMEAFVAAARKEGRL